MKPIFFGLIAAVTTIVGTAGVVFAQGPYGGANLPAGVQAAQVDGQTLSLVDRPTTTDRQPTIAGTVDQSGGTIVLGVASQSPTNATLTVSASGGFSHKVAAPLELGEHEVFINAQKVGTFVIVGDQPKPPATGTDGTSGTGLNGWMLIGLTLTAVAVAAGGLYWRSTGRR